MSKRKIAALVLMSSGYMMALGCSLFGPLRLSVNSILGTLGIDLTNLGGLLGGNNTN